MTLGTHVIVGVAAAELFPSHPVIAFVAAFTSHFVFDAIPHWDYEILSDYANPDSVNLSTKAKINKLFLFDLLRTGLDTLIGIVVVLVLWRTAVFGHFEIITLGIFGSVLPDFLQLVYTRFPHQPISALQKFHTFIHTEYRLKNRPIIGISTQVIIVIFVVVLAKYLVQL